MYKETLFCPCPPFLDHAAGRSRGLSIRVGHEPPIGSSAPSAACCDRTVATFFVVVSTPILAFSPGVVEAHEPVSIQTLGAELAIEALDEAILHRFARRDVVPFDVVLLLPSHDGVRGELGAVIADQHARVATEFGDAIELAHDPQAGERSVRHQAEAFSREVIDQR